MRSIELFHMESMEVNAFVAVNHNPMLFFHVAAQNYNANISCTYIFIELNCNEYTIYMVNLFAEELVFFFFQFLIVSGFESS